MALFVGCSLSVGRLCRRMTIRRKASWPPAIMAAVLLAAARCRIPGRRLVRTLVWQRSPLRHAARRRLPRFAWCCRCAVWVLHAMAWCPRDRRLCRRHGRVHATCGASSHSCSQSRFARDGRSELVSPLSLTALSLWFSVMLSLGGFGLVLRALSASAGFALTDFHGLYDSSPALQFASW